MRKMKNGVKKELPLIKMTYLFGSHLKTDKSQQGIFKNGSEMFKQRMMENKVTYFRLLQQPCEDLFFFFREFNTIQLVLLSKKLQKRQVDVSTIAWITDYLSNRQQFVRLNV